MTNVFALNHDKSLQIYFFCVKRQAKNDFLKDVQRIEVLLLWLVPLAYCLYEQAAYIWLDCADVVHISY